MVLNKGKQNTNVSIKEMKNASYTNESIVCHLSFWNVFMKCLFDVKNNLWYGPSNI